MRDLNIFQTKIESQIRAEKKTGNRKHSSNPEPKKKIQKTKCRRKKTKPKFRFCVCRDNNNGDCDDGDCDDCDDCNNDDDNWRIWILCAVFWMYACCVYFIQRNGKQTERRLHLRQINNNCNQWYVWSAQSVLIAGRIVYRLSFIVDGAWFAVLLYAKLTSSHGLIFGYDIFECIFFPSLDCRLKRNWNVIDTYIEKETAKK